MAEIYNNTGDITASTTWELPAISLDQIRALRVELNLTDPGGLVGDTLAIYFQVRFASGIWSDRIAFTPLLGNGGAKYEALEIQTDVPIGYPAGQGPMYGPSPLAAHLAGPDTIDGALPAVYLGSLVTTLPPGPRNQPLTCARFEFVEVGTATWPLTLRVDAIDKAIGY